MRRVVVILVALSLCGVVAPASAAAPLRTLSGVVTSGVDGSPLDGIEVCATRSTGAETCTQTTGDGTYRLTTREGKVRLRAREPYRYGQWVEQERRLTITRSTTANFTLRPGARGDRRSDWTTRPRSAAWTWTCSMTDPPWPPRSNSQVDAVSCGHGS